MDGTPTHTYALTVYREYGDRDENGDLIYEAQTFENYTSELDAFEEGLTMCNHSERLNKITITREGEDMIDEYTYEPRMEMFGTQERAVWRIV